jgi:hypothetical protein
MRKNFLIAILLLLLAGCSIMEPVKVREQKYGSNVPVITNSFAAQKIRAGDLWKIYLEASDPDGDMKTIVCSIDQPGVSYPSSFTRIREGQRKNLSGYIFLTTKPGINLVNLTLNVQIMDEAGHYSAPVSFRLVFGSKAKQENPPSGVFKENELGPINIDLQPIRGSTS